MIRIQNQYKTRLYTETKRAIKQSQVNACKSIIHFPKADMSTDIMYRASIAKDAGIPFAQIDKLKSIVGPEELKGVVQKNTNNRAFWVPGERPAGMEQIADSNPLTNVENRKFGASIHIHTTKSDGMMTVKQVLNQAAEYANEYAKTNKDRFIVGITDHNTIEGCKEAVRILAANPEKYKNLGVVLGTEISTKEKQIGNYNLRKPEKMHILSLCINPFDKGVEGFMKALLGKSSTPMFPQDIGVQQAVDGFKTQKYNWFSLAHPAFPDMKHRVQNGDDYCDATVAMMKHFKDKAQDKALYAENYYASYFGEMAVDERLKDTINKTGAALDLYKAGGIDTHGTSIFYSGANEIRTKNVKNKKSA